MRLADMREAAEKAIDYCKHLNGSEDFSKESKTLDACIRNFQVLGEAAKKIPTEIKKEISDIPWKQIQGMRNLLVHEYFGVSPSILWNTIRNDLPLLSRKLADAHARFDKPVHPWRICPPGEFYVRDAKVRAHIRKGSYVQAHLRRDHCREAGSSGKDVLTLGEVQDIADIHFSKLNQRLGSLKDFGGKGDQYDALIIGWTRYWNEVLKPQPALDPALVKALIASESSFNELSNKGKKKAAKGLLQILPATIRYLNGEQKELRDHIFEFADADVYDPSLNISAGIRWLFRKRETASISRLKRQASWEEAVEEYKDYLRRRLKNPQSPNKGMDVFRKAWAELKEQN